MNIHRFISGLEFQVSSSAGIRKSAGASYGASFDHHEVLIVQAYFLLPLGHVGPT